MKKSIFLIFLFAFVAGARDAHAYLDLNTGSLFLQAISAGAAGLLVVMRFVWIRLRTKILGAQKARE